MSLFDRIIIVAVTLVIILLCPVWIAAAVVQSGFARLLFLSMIFLSAYTVSLASKELKK